MLADLGFVCRPIDAWPGAFTKNRTRSAFSAQWGKTIELLRRELSYLNAKNGSLLLAVDERDIILDGTRPRANARMTHPGVILAFDSKHGPLKYACDRFDHWQDNIRAIALGLEALRAVDRYGITRKGEQYQGYKQLGGPKQGRDAAADLLASYCEISAFAILNDPELVETAFRYAAKKTHPDMGGHPDAFRAVQQARETLAGATA